MKINLSLLFIILLTIPTLAMAYQSHEEIVRKFMEAQTSTTIDPIQDESRVMNQYRIPKLDKVIPKYMQQRLRSGPVQGDLSFEGFSKGVDLRFRDTPILSQVGSRCSAYGLIASIENLLGAPHVAKISESHLWSKYRRYSSVSAVYAAKRMSITEHNMWPHDRKYPSPGWNEKAHTSLQHITYIKDDVLRAVKALGEGRPVYIGLSVSSSMARCESVLHPNSPDTGGGHAISISGYKIDKRVAGGGYFIVKNSWSKKCGDEGYQYLPFNYCTRRGSSYCIMWDVQGVRTSFPGVQSVEPELPQFDLSQVQIRISSYRPWYRKSRKVSISIDGNSLHARQIRDVSFSVDDGEFTKPTIVDVDTVKLSFRTRATGHNILLRITLNDGTVLDSQHRWGRAGEKD